MYDSMKNKTALVTGGGMGIGRATCEAFASVGVNVVVADINEEAAKETIALVESKGAKAVFSLCDVTNLEQIKATVELAENTFGRLHFACNNAGVHLESAPNPITEVSDEIWDKTMEINLRSVFRCMKAELESLNKHNDGVIINTASMAGLLAEPHSIAYTASKHGVIGLTKASALEYARSGIRINAVCPGPVDTPMIAGAPEELKEQFKAMLPSGRFATAEEVASTILWLCSDGASYIHGVGLPIDHGISVV
jgi:NAD(P)-dependent dehydrogenase (short-subunit alcohol dehydrogenase family)